jgi:hypothetical protein
MIVERFTYLVNEYLPRRHPTIFTLQQNSYVLNTVANKSLPTIPPSDPMVALCLLTINIDEDSFMVLPRPDGDEYSLQSFIWCYPVGFDQGDKLGLKLREAHKLVWGMATNFRGVWIGILRS